MNKAKFTANIDFAWMESEKAFQQNAMQGVVISVSFAFIVLMLATLNIVVSILSIASIAFTVCSVVTVMQLSGWELGVSESVATVIIIGFSVDYVVHLAAHYIHSPFQFRFKRIQESLREMGISILSGGLTTLGSGIFLFFAHVVIFQKFAIIFTSTILFSLTYSLIWFVAVVHIMGPQKHTGDLKFYAMWVFNKIRCKKEAS